MRISGTEPSSVIHSQKGSFKSLKEMTQKCQNKLSQKGLCYKPTKLQISINFNTENLGALKRYEST